MFSSPYPPFLDTMVYIENNILITKLYKSLLTIRCKRIITDPVVLKAELESLKQNFIFRNYPNGVIDTAVTAINKVNSLIISDLLQYKSKSLGKFNGTPLVLTYSNALVSSQSYNIHKVINNSWIKFIT